MMSRQLLVDNFCKRQWEANYAGSRFHGTGVTEEALEAACNEFLNSGGGKLVDGYAPFCKHLFMPNRLSDKLQASTLKITPDLQPLIKSGYEARTPKELAVLSRWIEAKDLPRGAESIPKAEWLDVILYSREQIRKENEAMGMTPVDTDAPWGIISVKAQNEPFELPMTPMTIMRNALGKEEGGSGVPLNREEYDKAVKYWEEHVFVRA